MTVCPAAVRHAEAEGGRLDWGPLDRREACETDTTGQAAESSEGRLSVLRSRIANHGQEIASANKRPPAFYQASLLPKLGGLSPLLLNLTVPIA